MLNSLYVMNVLSAIQLPKEIAVVKCAAHKTGNHYLHLESGSLMRLQNNVLLKLAQFT